MPSAGSAEPTERARPGATTATDGTAWAVRARPQTPQAWPLDARVTIEHHRGANRRRDHQGQGPKPGPQGHKLSQRDGTSRRPLDQSELQPARLAVGESPVAPRKTNTKGTTICSKNAASGRSKRPTVLRATHRSAAGCSADALRCAAPFRTGLHPAVEASQRPGRSKHKVSVVCAADGRRHAQPSPCGRLRPLRHAHGDATHRQRSTIPTSRRTAVLRSTKAAGAGGRASRH